MGGTIVGREPELTEIAGFLDAVPAGTSALMIEGEPGIGKTTLWQAGLAGAQERSWRALVARPVESEAKLSFAAIGDLMGESLDEALPCLPPPQRHALEIALLLREPGASAPEQRAVAVAFLGALRGLARGGPVVLAVDDVQWLDPPSAAVLEFAARRLRDEPVGVLLASRPVSASSLRQSLERGLGERWRRIQIGPLSLGALHGLLQARLGKTYPRPVIRHVHETSGGNPFFALELAGALERRGGRVDPGQPLPVPDELQTLVTARLDALPRTAQEVLLAAAALSQPTVALVQAAVAGDAERLLEPAVEAHVVEVADEAIRFAHPLLASAAYAQASPARRRAIHRRLAVLVSDPEESARHLALTAEGPDETVADALDQAAGSAFLRGATHAAVELSERARRLTAADRPDQRRRRATAEAEYRIHAGDSSGARDLLEEVLETCPSGQARAEVLSRLADTHLSGLDWRSSVEFHRRVLAEAGADDAVRARSEIGLADALFLLRAPIAETAVHARAAARLAERLGDRSLLGRALAMEALSKQARGLGFQASLMERACALQPWMDGVPTSLRPNAYLAIALTYLDDLRGALERYDALLQEARDHGDELSLVWLLGRAAMVRCLLGAWDEGLRHIDEGEALSPESGQPSNHAFLLAVRALVEAHLGHAAAAREAAAGALELAERVDVVLVRTVAAWALGLLELSLGQPVEAHRFLSPLVAETLAAALREPGEQRFFPDEIEALVLLGEAGQAGKLLDDYERGALEHDRPSARAAAGRCRGQLLAGDGDDAAAIVELEGALGQHARVPMPLERARTLLVMGEAQRRAKHKREARETLRQALAEFERLGAALWAERARAELARIGGRRPSGSELTPTERQVAALVADGLTNRDVASRLFLTQKTVEFHLRNVYRKLGIRSRTELTRALAGKA